MELRSRRILGRSTDNVHTNMSGDEFRRDLPDELVEKILAMLPFPQIFKGRVLSKSWLLRFYPVSSQPDEEKRLLAVAFQKRVYEWSTRWKISCPIFLFTNFLMAYDRAFQRWHTIPTLPVLGLREATRLKDRLPRHPMPFSALVGALLFITTAPPHITFVINIFTGSWKELPALPHMDWRSGTLRRLVSTNEMYKVISLHSDAGYACAWIYDSKLGAWKSMKCEMPEVPKDFDIGMYDVYLNGIVYVMILVDRKIWGFLTFDVKDETLSALKMPPTCIISNDHAELLQLVPFNGTVYVVVPTDNSVYLLEADLGSARWSKRIRGPPAALAFGSFWDKAWSTDGEDSLFFEGTVMNPRRRPASRPIRKILAYNARDDNWSYFPLNRTLRHYLRSSLLFYFNASFQPGMNLFLEA